MKALILGSLFVAYSAHAANIDMLPMYDNAPKVERAHVHKISHHKPKAKPKRKRKAKQRPQHQPNAHAFRPPPAAPSDGSKCFDPITVVGSQWVGESGAYESAVKAAKELVRWKIGEMAMDPVNWKDVARRCSMSSVGEVVGQTFHRCEIVFTPCRPGMTESGK